MHDLQPILRFIAFFQCDLKLIDEIGSAGSVIAFVYVGTDPGTAPKQLVNDSGRLAAIPQLFGNVDNRDRKALGQRNKLIIRHRNFSFYAPQAQFTMRGINSRAAGTIHDAQHQFTRRRQNS